MRVRRREAVIVLTLPALLIAAAWLRWGIAGLPPIPRPAAGSVEAPPGFPGWLRLAHFANFLFLALLVRSGLQILMEHPRLYWNVHCTPRSEWLRLTPIEVPRDRVWTAKDDARHLSPWIGLPGYRHTVGMARHWHFLAALFWIANGLVFIALVLSTDHWRRLVPTSWRVIPDAWAVFVHYATFHLPQEPDGFVRYNALQQISYFGVVFVLSPLAMVAALSMSPALTARFAWYARLPGNRQIGRSLHFLVMCGFVAFTLIHVALVAITGLARNMNHIALGTDGPNRLGIWVGAAGIAAVVAINALANVVAWKRPRLVQHAAKRVVEPVMRSLLDRAAPRAEFPIERISPHFWVNGKVPTCDEWLRLADDGFRTYRLRVQGLVERPVELSLADLRGIARRTQVTLHHCIQGWSGIAAWTGVPLAALIAVVRPSPLARAVVFHSFGDGVAIDRPQLRERYYDSLSLRDATHPQTLLADEMNGEPLGRLHGAPLRLRVENQLGFKMVKWIRSIEFVADVATVGGGEGGFAQDNEFFGELANI